MRSLLHSPVSTEDQYFVRKVFNDKLAKELLDFDAQDNFKTVLNPVVMNNAVRPNQTSTILDHYTSVIQKVAQKTEKKINVDNNFETNEIIKHLKDNSVSDGVLSPVVKSYAEQYSIQALTLSHHYPYWDIEKSFNNVFLNETENVSFSKESLHSHYENVAKSFRLQKDNPEAIIPILNVFARKILKASVDENYSEQNLQKLNNFWTAVGHGAGISETITLLVLDQNMLVSVGVYSYTFAYFAIHEPDQFRYVVNELKSLSSPYTGVKAQEIVSQYTKLLAWIGTGVYAITAIYQRDFLALFKILGFPLLQLGGYSPRPFRITGPTQTAVVTSTSNIDISSSSEDLDNQFLTKTAYRTAVTVGECCNAILKGLYDGLKKKIE